MSCGQVHSQARQLVAAGQPGVLVAQTLEISRSRLYYRRQERLRMPIAAMMSASSKQSLHNRVPAATRQALTQLNP